MFIKTRSVGCLQAFYTYKLQVEVFREGHYGGKIFRGDVFAELAQKRRFGEIGRPDGGLRSDLTLPADEDVGDVGSHRLVFFGGVAEEVVGDPDVEVGAFGGFLFPFVVAVNVGEGDDGAATEDFDFVSELCLAAYGHPDALGHQGGGDDGGFLGFNEGNGFVGVFGQEVFSEETLGESPVGREPTLLLEE